MYKSTLAYTGETHEVRVTAHHRGSDLPGLDDGYVMLRILRPTKADKVIGIHRAEDLDKLIGALARAYNDAYPDADKYSVGADGILTSYERTQAEWDAAEAEIDKQPEEDEGTIEMFEFSAPEGATVVNINNLHFTVYTPEADK